MKQQGKEGASFQGIIGVRWKKGVFLLSLCLCVMFSIFTPFVTKAIYSYLFRDILSFSTFLLFSTQNKTIVIEIHLIGEIESSTAKIDGCSFVFEDEHCGVKFEKIETNKEWFNLLANDFLVGKMLPIKNANACNGLKMFFK